MYTPNNLQIYLAASTGAMAGMAASYRIPTDPSPSTYAGQAVIADAFAQAVDTLIPPSPTPLPPDPISLLNALSYAVWQDRSPIVDASSILPATYASLAAAIAAIGTAQNAQFVSQGINPSADNSMQSYSPTFANLDSTATIGDGSITGVYKQDGDTLSFAIQVVAGTTTDYGTGSPILVPLPPGYTIDPSKLNPAVFLAVLGVSVQGWQSNIAGVITGSPALFPFLMFRAETAPTVFQDITVIPVTGPATPGDAFLFTVTGLPIMLI